MPPAQRDAVNPAVAPTTIAPASARLRRAHRHPRRGPWLARRGQRPS